MIAKVKRYTTSWRKREDRFELLRQKNLKVGLQLTRWECRVWE
jgi:hypothetical protein